LLRFFGPGKIFQISLIVFSSLIDKPEGEKWRKKNRRIKKVKRNPRP